MSGLKGSHGQSWTPWKLVRAFTWAERKAVWRTAERTWSKQGKGMFTYDLGGDCSLTGKDRDRLSLEQKKVHFINGVKFYDVYVKGGG